MKLEITNTSVVNFLHIKKDGKIETSIDTQFAPEEWKEIQKRVNLHEELIEEYKSMQDTICRLYKTIMNGVIPLNTRPIWDEQVKVMEQSDKVLTKATTLIK